MKSYFAGAALVSLSLLATSPTAPAAVGILATSTLETGYSQPVSASTWTPVSLASGGVKSLSFKTGKLNQRVVITYNGECASSSFVTYLRMKVDGGLAEPSGYPVLCGFTGTAAVLVSRTTVITIPATGAHTLTVEVLGSAAGPILLGQSIVFVQS